jgi:alanyl-tRNA synthetase
MTGQRAAAEPYTTRWETTVEWVDGRDVGLDVTYFYAESGGQPADRGTIGDVAVTDVGRVDGQTVHTVADPTGLAAGNRLICTVDWAFRTYCMRAHTASHALYGVAREHLDDLGYGGFDIGAPAVDDIGTVDDAKVRVDLRTSTTVDDDVLVDIEAGVNRAVWESRPVSWNSVPVEEARSREGVAFNTKTEEGVLSSSDSVRLVTIEGRTDEAPPLDVAACGGTHARNTRQVGPVTVLERSNPGEGLTRVEFAVGPPGVRRRAAEKRALFDAARAFDAAPREAASAAQDLRARVEDLETTVTDLRGDLVAAELAGAESVDRDGRRWIAATVDGVGPNDVRETVLGAVGDDADVVVLAGTDGATFVVTGSAGDPPAEDVVADLTDRFGGGGGGSERFAQGGGLDASPEAVVAHLRE